MVYAKVVGATGYTGGEIIRLLLSHSEVEIVSLEAKIPEAGKFTDFFPNFKGIWDKEVILPTSGAEDDGAQVVFVAVPDGITMHLAENYLNRGVKVIDISADFRFADQETHKAWYNIPHKAEKLLSQAVYGLPELFAEKIRTANLLANPGCYPTSAILALAPLLIRHKQEPLVDLNSIIVDSKSGVSGAGRNPSTVSHFPERNENFCAYKIASHRHTPEIEQAISWLCGREVQINFTPHLVPMNRGILSTTYIDLTKDMMLEEIQDLYKEFYAEKPFVRVLTSGQLPNTAAVCGTNFCDISVVLDERTGRIILVSALDNLVKGAAGQAVQNMNLMFGLKETTGLLFPGLLI